jgi:undecaprenyl-diphosphatase
VEEAFLRWVHGKSGPVLDALFRFSHELGTLTFCTLLVVAAAGWLLGQRQRIEAALWIALGLSTWALQAGVKEVVARARPNFWVGPIVHTSYAFPSGHAIAAATFFPMLAFTISRRRPAWRTAVWLTAFGLALFVGFGRLYLGVHWPSDVMGGYAIGALQTFAAIRLATRYEPVQG